MMGVYLQELTPIYGYTGTRELSLLIEHSFRTRSVLLEVYNDNEEWTLYWRFEVSGDEFISFVRQYSHKGITIKEAFADEDIIRELQKISPVYSCTLLPDEISLIQELLRCGLKDVKQKPQGFDGHSYTIRLNDETKEYRCWCELPKEWAYAGQVIECLVRKAGLSEKYLVTGIT